MAQSQEVAINPFTDLLPPDLTAESVFEFSADAARAAFIAFNNHLGILADVVDVQPDIAQGDMNISIPAFFGHELRPTNPLNDVAFSLLDELGHGPTSNAAEARADRVKNHGIFQLPGSELTVVRDGKSVEAFVVDKLGLANPAVLDGFERTHRYRKLYPKDEQSKIKRTQQLLYGITQDFDTAAVGEVKDIYDRVTERGYTDFFDYLLDVRTVTTERVEKLFSCPAQQPEE